MASYVMDSAATPPLQSLRVLDTSAGIAGPWAARLLAMYGATVVKVEPEGGDPARHQQVDDVPADGSTSPLFVHLNAAKRPLSRAAVDAGQPTWDRLVDWADLVVSSATTAELSNGPLARLLEPLRSADDDRARLVNLTAWGPDAPHRGHIRDELLVQAATGFLGFNRDLDQPPLRLPGWQSQYSAGALGAIAGMAALRTDTAVTDITWLAALLTATELCYGDALHCERPRTPVGAHPPTAYPSGAIPCKDGFVAPGSIRPIDWEMQCLFYGIPEWIDDQEYAHRHKRPAKIDEIWERIEPWYAERTKREIFGHALDSPWACGMVMTPLDALADEHLAERAFLTGADSPPGMPVRPVRMPGLPVATQQLLDPSTEQDAAAAALITEQHAEAQAEAQDKAPRTGSRRPMEGLRIIEMTISWAGPYVGNILGPLGAEIIKIESLSPYDGFRAQRPYDHGMAPGQEHLVADNRFFEAGGLFNAVNKGKKDCVVSLRDPDGRAAFLELIAECDGLVANFSAHVLPDLGLDWATVSEVNPKFVVVRAPAFGTVGPYSGAVGYGSIVEAMSGLGHRQGYEHEGARISNIYFPDPVAGMHIANALMAGLEQADRTGRGVEIDLSHQEASWLHNGEALVLAGAEGQDIGRMGNREPGVQLSTITATADGWIALVATADELAAAGLSSQEAIDAVGELATEEAERWCAERSISAVATLDPWTAPLVSPVVDLLDVVDHPVTGPKRHIGSPFTLDGQRAQPSGPAPLFDQHTDEVFATIAGLDADRIADLREQGAIGGTLPTPAEIGLRYEV